MPQPLSLFKHSVVLPASAFQRKPALIIHLIIYPDSGNADKQHS